MNPGSFEWGRLQTTSEAEQRCGRNEPFDALKGSQKLDGLKKGVIPERDPKLFLGVSKGQTDTSPFLGFRIFLFLRQSRGHLGFEIMRRGGSLSKTWSRSVPAALR